MMKIRSNTALLAFSLLCAVTSTAQSIAIEKAYMNQMFKDGEIDATEVGLRKREVEALAYPSIDFDTSTGMIGYIQVHKFPGIKKEVLYERVVQWAAMAYNDSEATTRYSNKAEGKLITRGYAIIPYKATYKGIFGMNRSIRQQVNCWHTLTFTVIDGAVKVSFLALKYHFKQYDISATGNRTVIQEIHLSDIFPLSQHPSGTIKGMCNLVTNTLSEHERVFNWMVKYVGAADEDYKF